MELDHDLYRKHYLLITVAALAVAVMSIVGRPLSPVNETLYSGVAWDMWTQHHTLIPWLNGAPYTQKPPLFFWLVELGWHVFGVNSWWPRLLPALCSLGSIFLAAKTADKLFTKHAQIALLTALILLGMAYWSYYAPRARLDQLLTLCITCSYYGLGRALRRESYGFLWFGLGNGLAILTKGPICFIFTLVPAILAPLCIPAIKNEKAAWYRALCGSLLLSVTIVAAWAVPIILKDPHYAKNILWNQTASRLEHTRHTQMKVWYYYITRLPLLIMPWLLWPLVWAGFKKFPLKQDAILRWLSYSVIAIFCILSLLIGQKGSRFLLPLMPLLAILFSYSLCQSNRPTPVYFYRLVALIFIVLATVIFLTKPMILLFKPHTQNAHYLHAAWGILPLVMGGMWWFTQKRHTLHTATLITLSSCLVSFLMYAIIEPMQNVGNNQQTTGAFIHLIQQSAYPVAFIGMDHYDDRFQLAGRITKPIITVPDSRGAISWAFEHNNGYIIQTTDRPADAQAVFHPIYQQPYRHNQYVQIWQAKSFILANTQ